MQRLVSHQGRRKGSAIGAPAQGPAAIELTIEKQVGTINQKR
jgi:hypothetical protein